MLPLQRAQVPSLVGALRSFELGSEAERKEGGKKERKRLMFTVSEVLKR